MSSDNQRSVRVERTGPGTFKATNTRGGTVTFGSGEGTDFTPVELLLAALAGCTAIDAEVATTRHVEPTEFTVEASGDKISDDQGSRLENLAVTFTVRFPEGEEGDKARAILPRAVRTSHDKLCTVSRTIEIGTPVTSTVA